MGDKYILKDKTPVEVDTMTWARWFESAGEQRVVARTELGGCLISTVFLGLNHQWGGGPPLLFETIVFEGPQDGEMWRCSTWDEAEAQHAEAVQIVRNALP